MSDSDGRSCSSSSRRRKRIKGNRSRCAARAEAALAAITTKCSDMLEHRLVASNWQLHTGQPLQQSSSFGSRRRSRSRSYSAAATKKRESSKTGLLCSGAISYAVLYNSQSILEETRKQFQDLHVCIYGNYQ